MEERNLEDGLANILEENWRGKMRDKWKILVDVVRLGWKDTILGYSSET